MGQSRISTPRPRSPVPRPPPLLHHPQTYHLLLLTAHFFPSPVPALIFHPQTQALHQT